MSKLGGELDEEKQLNKSLRENQEEWQVPQKKIFIIKLIAFFSDFWLAPGPYSGPTDTSKEGWGWGGSAAAEERPRDRGVTGTGHEALI